jgi:hypothetical protein
MTTHQILFAYYDKGEDKLLQQHYAALVRDNPGDDVVPITCGYPSRIPGTVDLHKTAPDWIAANGFEEPDDVTSPAGRKRMWASYDRLCFYRYLHLNRDWRDRTTLVEWDVASRGMSFREFFGDKFEQPIDMIGIDMRDNSNPNDGWCWRFDDPHFCGFIPGTGRTLSKAALHVLTGQWPSDLACRQDEVAASTFLRRRGLTLGSVAERASMYHTWGGPAVYDKNKKGIYHPITFYT